MARTRQQVSRTSALANEPTEEQPHNRQQSTINKVGTSKIQEAEKSSPPTSQQVGTLRSQLVQHEESFDPASMKKKKKQSNQ